MMSASSLGRWYAPIAAGLMIGGASVAWGPGGAAFALGLYLALGAFAEAIVEGITSHFTISADGEQP